MPRIPRIGNVTGKIKMEIKIACTWGDGPDVAMNLHPSEADQEGMMMFGDDLIPVDLTADEAMALAGELLVAARQAKELEELAATYADEELKKEMQDEQNGQATD